MDVTTVRRGYKRARASTRRSRMAVQRVPRTIRYNGENKITRVTSGSIGYSNGGWIVGAGTSEALNFVFDPTGVTAYIAALTSQNFALPNAAELAALYDHVRIDKVEITWAGNHQAQTAANASAAYPPRFLVCNDDNDGIGTATVVQIQQAPNKAFFQADGTQMKWTCYPKYQRIVYLTSLVSNYEASRGFVNTDSAIPHYGVKLGITNIGTMSATTSGFVDFNFKFFLTLKNVK